LNDIICYFKQLSCEKQGSREDPNPQVELRKSL
jgi:hypothetical protein